MMSQNVCCVPGCLARKEDGVPLHRFPNPETYPEKFNIWISNIGGDLSTLDVKTICNNRRVCHNHFEDVHKYPKSKLCKLATPLLHLPGSDGTVLHLFPNYRKEPVRFRTWVYAIGGNLLVFDDETIFKHRRVCHSHFKPRYYTTSKRLCANAVPTLKLSGSSVCENNDGGNNESANTTNVTLQTESNNDKNTTSELINRRTSCDTTDSVKSSGIREDPLAIETDEVADRTVSDSESYLEDIDEEISEWSDGIFEEFAQKWEPILKDGLIKRPQDENNSNYLFCKNLPSSKPPLLNTEIANLLTEEIKYRDNELVNKQSQLGHALAALGKAMTGLRTNTMEASDILETLNDVGELIAELHYLETEARRSLILQELDKSFAEPLKDRLRDEYLFGQDVDEILKPPEAKTTASSITPRMISTFLNKKKVQSPAASSPVRQITKITVQKNVKRPAALTPGDQITKKLRQCIETSLTTLRTREEELSSDTGTAAPDPDPDQTTTDPTAALSQLNNIQIYDENGQPLSPEQQPAPPLTNDTEILERDYEGKDTGNEDICIILLDEASLT